MVCESGVTRHLCNRKKTAKVKESIMWHLQFINQVSLGVYCCIVKSCLVSLGVFPVHSWWQSQSIPSTSSVCSWCYNCLDLRIPLLMASLLDHGPTILNEATPRCLQLQQHHCYIDQAVFTAVSDPVMSYSQSISGGLVHQLCWEFRIPSTSQLPSLPDSYKRQK